MAASMCAACYRQVVFGYSNWTNVHAALSLSTRWYARGIKRTPFAVRTREDDMERLRAKGVSIKDPKLNPFIPYIPGDPTQDQFSRKVNKQLRPSDKQNANLQQKQQKNKKATAAKSESRDFISSGLQYEKLEDGDKRFGRVLMAAKSRKEREKSGIILMEGRRLILDSLRAGAQLKYLYFSEASLVASLPASLLVGAELYKVQYRHLKVWADTQSPAGILGVFAKPASGEVLCPQPGTLPLTLICDNVRDPGNLGTIIRTAAAAGCKKIITAKGCVDVWDPKVLRGAMGGHFYMCVLNSLPWENIANHVSSSAYLCIADNRKSSAVEKSFDVSHPKVQDLLASEDMDSSSSSDEETDAEENSQTSADGGEKLSKDAEDSKTYKDTAEVWSKAQSELYKRVPLSVVTYSDMDCSRAEEVAVIIGGEAEGVSVQAKKLAFERYGHYVTIPMVQAVDSLNTATAAAIVLFEAQRQMIARIKSQQRQPAHNRSDMS